MGSIAEDGDDWDGSTDEVQAHRQLHQKVVHTETKPPSSPRLAPSHLPCCLLASSKGRPR